MTTTLARMRLKILGGAALLALMVAMLLAAQPAEAQQVTLTGDLVAGQTNRCVLVHRTDNWVCTVTVPGTGSDTMALPNPPNARSFFESNPALSGR